MSGLNRVELIGHIGKDPEIRSTASSTVANLNMATTMKFKDKKGEIQEKTEWHRIVIWGKLAEIVRKYVLKGSHIYISGRLETSWDKDGVKTYVTEIIADTMLMLGKAEVKERNQSVTSTSASGKVDTDSFERGDQDFPGKDDDLPF